MCRSKFNKAKVMKTTLKYHTQENGDPCVIGMPYWFDAINAEVDVEVALMNSFKIIYDLHHIFGEDISALKMENFEIDNDDIKVDEHYMQQLVDEKTQIVKGDPIEIFKCPMEENYSNYLLAEEICDIDTQSEILAMCYRIRLNKLKYDVDELLEEYKNRRNR